MHSDPNVEAGAEEDLCAVCLSELDNKVGRVCVCGCVCTGTWWLGRAMAGFDAGNLMANPAIYGVSDTRSTFDP